MTLRAETDAFSCAVNCCVHWVLIATTLDVLCVIAAIEMDACSRPSVSNCDSYVLKGNPSRGEYTRLGRRYNHPCLYTHMKDTFDIEGETQMLVEGLLLGNSLEF